MIPNIKSAFLFTIKYAPKKNANNLTLPHLLMFVKVVYYT